MNGLAQIAETAFTGRTAAELQWLSGYAAGLAAATGETALPQVPAVNSGRKLTILYGSQTGNSQGVAEALAARAREAGYAVALTSLAEFKPANLKRESLLAIVVSTHGEGDPPDDAELFHEYLLSDRAPKLEGLRYSVLALGDSSYINFCETGRQFDTRLAELGGERLLPIIECDLDYDEPAGAWADELLSILPDQLESTGAVSHLRPVESPAYDRGRPFEAEVLLKQPITGSGSTKEVQHIELSLEGSGIVYEPGDALGVIVENPPQLVQQFIDELGFDADARVELGEEESALRDVLASKVEITAPNLGFIEAWAGLSGASGLTELLTPEHRETLTELMESHQIIDIVRRYPASVRPVEFVSSLRKLSPRSYSIASSQRANPDEVHLTVAAVRYDAFGSQHWGAGSTYLTDRIEEGATLKVFVEPNTRFRLPADDVPVVMIGPGTGVAPFRAFIEERAERHASGDNWLFFGDRNFSSDFLYQLEWQRHLKQGRLRRLDVAFSRDQERKVYVQDRIRERAAELYEWIENGAHLYVCGDAKHMAPDVHSALVDVIAAGQGVTADEAERRLKELRGEGRYQRDVY